MNEMQSKITQKIIEYLQSKPEQEMLLQFFMMWQDAMDFLAIHDLIHDYNEFGIDRDAYYKKKKIKKYNHLPKVRIPEPDLDN